MEKMALLCASQDLHVTCDPSFPNANKKCVLQSLSACATLWPFVELVNMIEKTIMWIFINLTDILPWWKDYPIEFDQKSKIKFAIDKSRCIYYLVNTKEIKMLYAFWSNLLNITNVSQEQRMDSTDFGGDRAKVKIITYRYWIYLVNAINQTAQLLSMMSV